MKISFLVERPTQFETPFYRFAAADPAHELRVLYFGAEPEAAAFDPELGRPVSWGMELLAGYPHAICPASGRGRWLARELAPERCDLLIANGYTRGILLRAALAARGRGVATALRLDSTGDASAARRLAKRALFAVALKPLFDLFLGVGSLTLAYLDACGVPERRTGLFPYAVDVEHFRRASDLAPAERLAVRRRLGVPADARLVLSVAKFHPREAPWDLAAAFGLLAGEGDEWLVLAGDGPQRALLEAAARRHAPGRVVFPGYVPYPELPALYAAADLFVHAAREERWGVSVEEALACGLPVVASSRVGAAVDLVRPGENGFVYRSGDAADLAARLRAARALRPSQVRAASDEILARWDYAAAWRGLLAAAAGARREAA